MIPNKTHELYNTWQMMRKRCNNPRRVDYQYYGGRGVKVCKRWDDFGTFIKDVGERPGPDYQLHRIDVTGDYTPENVRWIHRSDHGRINMQSRYDRIYNAGYIAGLAEVA